MICKKIPYDFITELEINSTKENRETTSTVYSTLDLVPFRFTEMLSQDSLIILEPNKYIIRFQDFKNNYIDIIVEHEFVSIKPVIYRKVVGEVNNINVHSDFLQSEILHTFLNLDDWKKLF